MMIMEAATTMMMMTEVRVCRQEEVTLFMWYRLCKTPVLDTYLLRIYVSQ